MRIRKPVVPLLVAAGLLGCSHVPLPEITPYDSNPKARRDYLRGFAEGYRKTTKRRGAIYGVPFPGEEAEFFGYDAGRDHKLDDMRKTGKWP